MNFFFTSIGSERVENLRDTQQKPGFLNFKNFWVKEKVLVPL